MFVKATLPPFLDERGWRIAFGNAGADAFALEPGGGRHVIIRLSPGRNFNAAEVRTANDPIIEIEAFADGILVGGMSYPVELDAKKPTKPKRRSRGRARSRTLAKARSSRPAAPKTPHRVAAADLNLRGQVRVREDKAPAFRSGSLIAPHLCSAALARRLLPPPDSLTLSGRQLLEYSQRFSSEQFADLRRSVQLAQNRLSQDLPFLLA